MDNTFKSTANVRRHYNTNNNSSTTTASQTPSSPDRLHDNHYTNGSMTAMSEQDLLADMEGLNLSDQHPLEKRPVPRSMRGIFPDSTAFTPQSSDRFLFPPTDEGRQGGMATTDPNFMRRSLDATHNHFPALIRRESYPCLQSTSSTSTAHSDWGNGENMLRGDPVMMQSQLFRKFSVDVPYAIANKRLDLVDGTRGSRLTPSYSNPDLAAARRLSSMETARLQKQEGGLVSPHQYADGMVPPFLPSLMGYPFYPHLQGSNTTPTSSTSAAAAAAAAAAACNNANMNPLLLTHLMRHMNPPPPSTGSSSSPPSPTSKKSQQSAPVTPRRHNDQDRFASVRFEDVVNEIYTLCKDQYGCRYLQRKLEEQKDDQRDVIFEQVFPHFVELMTDPFGNYLCQKLMEHCTDDQRTLIVDQVSHDMVNISLNMHGTRAVQKMIEFITLPEQIDRVVVALAPNVVTLIKDLNGNHVIQRCLHRLSSDNKQFIYNAVSTNCVEVATHRHGCCVLQRCIDYSAEKQKAQLVTEIINHALTLVQDPFGNYVVQYVLDLGDAHFSDLLIRRFIGHVGSLSVQKFSSNVMEKCIRVAEADTRRHLIEEMANRARLEKLLRDSYANYVVQTALDYAEPTQRGKLVDCIRPLLPAIRNTPYGKRIQGKINREQRHHPQQTHQFPEGGLPMGYLAPWMAGANSEAGGAAGANEMAFFSPFQSPAAFGGSVPFSVFHNH